MPSGSNGAIATTFWTFLHWRTTSLPTLRNSVRDWRVGLEPAEDNPQAAGAWVR
jgi:hypothetical protein